MKRQIKSEKNDIKEIWRRIKTRDFSGNAGLAVKNSIYKFFTNFVEKIGSLIFTIILARFLLGPELFGLYSLALTTILLFKTFSDLGVDFAVVKFVSSSFGRGNEKKAKSYFSYLLKIRLILIFVTSFILVVLSKFIANNFYQQPLFYALLAGSMYLLFSGLVSIFNSLFQASNNFKKGFYKQLILQTTRLIFVPIVILLAINKIQTDFLLGFMFMALSLSFFIVFLFLYLSAKNQIIMLKEKKVELMIKEKKMINNFVISLSAMAISSMLFGYIDTIMLGKFIKEVEFIGFYRIALTLVGAAIPFLKFSGALFPIFSRLEGKHLTKGVKKTVKLTLLISAPCVVLVLVLANPIVNLIFGTEYYPSINLLRLFSILLIISPMIALYSTSLFSQNKQKIVAKALIFSSLINIILNYIFIKTFLTISPLAALYGATIATILSKTIYLGMLIINRKNK